jgi:phage shock protein E
MLGDIITEADIVFIYNESIKEKEGTIMGFLDFLKQPDIDQGVKEYRALPGAVLLDVRTPDEYREGHIPGSVNVALQSMDRVASVAKSKETPLFVYCYSGSRSRQAAAILQRMGYSNVNNIGGIAAYSGKVEQ